MLAATVDPQADHLEISRMHRLSFIRQIAATRENSMQWHALTLAHRALALVDLLSVDANDIDTSATAALRDDAQSFGDEDPIVSRVAIIATLLHARRSDCWPEITMTLLELSDLLQRACLAALALDVSLLALRLSAHNDVLAWRSHRFCGWAYRSLGAFDSAAIQYAGCIEIGQRLDCVEATFWGRNGNCLLVQERGNLPRAETLLRRVVAWIRKENRPDLEAIARHGLAITIGLRGRLRESLHHFDAALHASPSTEWGRILGNIGYTYLQLGQLEQSRDVFLGLIDTATDSYDIYLAYINLIQVYAACGQHKELENVRRYLELQPLFPAMVIDFQLTLGRAYSMLGDATRARPCFERAEALAHRIGIGRGVIEADLALAGLSRSSPIARFRDMQSNAFGALDSSESTVLPRLASRQQL